VRKRSKGPIAASIKLTRYRPVTRLAAFQPQGHDRRMTDDEEIPAAVLEGLMHHGIPVRAAREAVGLTIAGLQLTTAIDIDRLVAFEAGKATPTEAEAARIAKATGVPAEMFAEE
jgi:ribosome-binding protein aMBF1 (putative translation factor)